MKGRNRLQTVVIVLTTLVAVTASVVAAGVLAASRAPFEHAMSEQRGAHLTARFDGSRVTAGELAGTARVSGVSAAAGPFRTAEVRPRTDTSSAALPAGVTLPTMTVAGRADPEGPVDRLRLLEGRWATAPGEIVLGDGDLPAIAPGTRLQLPDVPGEPVLTVVGRARSVTGTADAWVTPAQADSLTGDVSYEMLYRLRQADTSGEVADARAAIGAAVPGGALTGTLSHLAVKQQQAANALAFVPFVAAFGVLALAMSVLIIGIVVSGAVGAHTRRIGILKSVGCTPAQVVRTYVGGALLPAAVGCALGLGFGNLLAVPVLADVETVYSSAPASVPWWVDVAAVTVALALVGLAALVPALRAGRLRTVEAIAVGRTPGTGRGRLARRVTGRLPVPHPVGLGLAHPFTRPARSATTAAAVALAAVTVTFAAGLALTLGAVETNRMLDAGAPVVVETGGGQAPPGANAVAAPGRTPGPRADPGKVTAALRAHPDTRRFYGTTQAEVTASGITGRTDVVAYWGDATWAAPELVSGRWLKGPGEAVVTDRFLDAAGIGIGDSVTLTAEGRRTSVRIVGEAFFTEGDAMPLLTATSTLGALGLDDDPARFHVEPSGDTASYLGSLNPTLEPLGALVHTSGDNSSSVVRAMDALIGMLTLMLVAVAGLGVLNTVVLDTRDRIHDLGVFKALGMTPRQTVGMVLTSVTGTGLLAAAAGVPLGVALHHYVTPMMGATVGMHLPEAFVAVYGPLLLTVLGLGGLTVAIGGALLPAGWAARTDTARALRTE
ncbi:ABC transporter permease [Streptomyces sp. NPDC088387]|uniref:ABC transporter permease n=1 Tax=Streptomyces sp. NPDC088387 TaxID=3365859 RepID=UPI003813BB31